MKIRHLVVGSSVFLCGGILFGQSSQGPKLFIPFLDQERQTNVAVIVSDPFGHGIPCPLKYTNVLSNTNLFTPVEKDLLADVFEKYKNVTTNSGPTGTEFIGRFQTNRVIKWKDKTEKLEEWVARFQYTNIDAHEEIMVGSPGISGRFRDKHHDGYNVSITQSGTGSILRFGEIKHDVPNGVFVEFDDVHPQGPHWDFRLANFADSHMEEYRHYTNRMAIGEFLMWDPSNNNLRIEAEFKEPYDLEKHRTDLRALSH